MTQFNKEHSVFVFGSNLGGIHGAGAARFAELNKGAVYGVGVGYVGDSYAIPTKNETISYTLNVGTISRYVEQFLVFAMMQPELQFQVTCIGCGLAGLKHEDIAPLFDGAPDNCFFDTLWQPFLGVSVNYWGTF